MLRLFAVRDVKADAYGAIICLGTRGLALRAFADACANSQSPMAQYPSDYSLYELGEFEPCSGVVKGLATPVFVASAVDVVQQLKSARGQEVVA